MLCVIRALRRVQASPAVLRHLAQQSSGPARLNGDLLRLHDVRLISEAGEDRGVMPSRKALSEARGLGRDLMEVNGHAKPPVVRIVDYTALQSARAKKSYDARKRGKENRKMERKEGALKQVRLSPSTDTHDMQIKMRRAREFLCDGYRVRVYMQFRRGQGRLQEDAKAALVAAAERLEEVGTVMGVPQGKEVADMFKVEKEDEEAMGVTVKKKPLEILIQPLSRKKRELLNKAGVEADA
ncbi:Translation initiation factor IF3, mitochondrial [Chondrus crispus]|uniref:Translation initiation factor IF3, mitochondrial n=1 Tax=Chondrus crispus TaxID=2769 RepID=R7Q6Y2_CHOCR|nr:Translation initiation factor IF3, mitochondrial [Chondrus crispus]CDF33794.1 Translation initiation factor IF3, mitochondrial [Chondrus crispus]|eukprot:XP_005713613.1 Translation initiation factor IF3, mitochondrial [Chondrus crispus]